MAASLARAFPEADVVVGGAAVMMDVRPDEALVRSAVSAIDELSLSPGRSHEIAVVYDGPDLEEVSTATGLSARDVVGLHAGATYEVEVAGFLPGFAYLAEVDPALRLPRRASPRKRVPAGSVAIASRYAGIYPFASPGGWHLLGRAVGVELFDPRREPPSLLAPGDRVRFAPVDRGEIAAAPPPEEEKLDDPHLTLTRCSPHATIQDRGRRLRSLGIPTSGAADLETHDAANRALGNDVDAATVEIPLDGLEAIVRRSVWVSLDGGVPERLEEGARLMVPRVDRAVRYLALEGGVDAPQVLGSRSTLAIAHLGGRRLRRGDGLRALGGASGERRAEPPPPLDRPTTLSIEPGPHLDRFPPSALACLVGSAWSVSPASDRVGTRLVGASVPRGGGADEGVPEPTWPGAVQVTTDGTPIVLGPDSAVTGGYPILAVVTREGRSRLARVRPGEPVTFVLRAEPK